MTQRKKKAVAKKREYVVLVPFGKAKNGLYQYEIRGGIFSSLRSAQIFVKKYYFGELIAPVTAQLVPEQRARIRENKF